MSHNDFTDFMLKEYECIAQAFFESREVLTKWFKYYLTIMALPLSLIALLYKDKSNEFNLYSLPSTLSISLIFVGFIGLFITFIMLNAAYDSVLYARAVNGVRQYFCNTENSILSSQNLSIDKYIVLPVDVMSPPYRSQFFTWIIISASVANSFYLSLGITQICITNKYLDKYTNISVMLFMFIIYFIIHIGYYHVTAYIKEKT